MTHTDGMSWLHFKSVYAQRFGYRVPDWICTLDMRRKLRLVRVACAIGMPLGERLLVRDESNDPTSGWT